MSTLSKQREAWFKEHGKTEKPAEPKVKETTETTTTTKE